MNQTRLNADLKRQRLEIHEAMLLRRIPFVESVQWIADNKCAHVDAKIVQVCGERRRTMLVECKVDDTDHAGLPVEMFTNVATSDLLSLFGDRYEKSESELRRDETTNVLRDLCSWHFSGRWPEAQAQCLSWRAGLGLVRLPELLNQHRADLHLTSYLRSYSGFRRWHLFRTERLQYQLQQHYNTYQGIIGPNNECGRSWNNLCLKVPEVETDAWVDGCYRVPVEEGLWLSEK